MITGHGTPLGVAHLIETDGPGGAERVVVELATSLQAAGAYNVVFLPANGEGWLAEQLRGSGVAIEYFRIDHAISPSCVRTIASAIRRHKVDLAHSHEFSLAMYGAWAARFAGVPHVVTMHGGRYYAQRLRRRLALRASLAITARTVAVSADLARAMSRDLWMDPSHLRVVVNGVRHVPPDHVTLRAELGLSYDAHLLVAVGNLYPVKGHAHLIDAMALLSDRYPTLHLAICGRGGLADVLAARARAAGLEGRVHLLGLRSDVPAVLSAADVFVLPSLNEGLPLALLEAMFAGLPIVASRVGEVPRALGYGDAGMLVPPGKPAAIAASLDMLLGDATYARMMAERAARRAHAEYDVSRMVEQYLRTYRALLRREVPSPTPRTV